MSDDTDDCIVDSKLMLNTEEINESSQTIIDGGIDDDVANDMGDDECATDVESEVAMTNTCDGGGSRTINDDGSLSPSTAGEVDTSCAGTSGRNGTSGKSCTSKKPVKRFSPQRNNESNRHWNSSCKIKSSSSSSSGETSEEGFAPPKKVRRLTNENI